VRPWSDDSGHIGDRIATVVPGDLHRAIADAAADAIRSGVPAQLLDVHISIRNSQLVRGPNRSESRLAKLNECIADAQRQAKNARRNANDTDHPGLATEFLADATNARQEEKRLVLERTALVDQTDLIGSTFESEADFIAQALGHFGTVDFTTDGAMGDAIAQILEISSMTVSEDQLTVQVEFYVDVPADRQTARLGPIYCTVDNRAHRNTLPDTIKNLAAGNTLIRLAIKHGLEKKARGRRNKQFLFAVSDCLVGAGYTKLAAGTITRSMIPSLHAAIAHDLWEEALPEGLDPAYAAHVVAIYKSRNFWWTPSRHAVNAADRQSLVDALIAAGGQIDASNVITQVGKQRAMFWRTCGGPQQNGKSPVWLPCIERMGEWAQGPAGKHKRFYKLIDCPHCGGHATQVVRTPETTACILCPDCRRQPTVDSPKFPDEYFH